MIDITLLEFEKKSSEVVYLRNWIVLLLQEYVLICRCVAVTASQHAIVPVSSLL